MAGEITVRKRQQRIAVIDENRYVSRADRYSTISADDMVTYTAQSAGIPESNVRACAKAVGEAVSYFVLNGHHVQLGKFGNFGIKIKGKSTKFADEASAKLVSKVGLRYIPSKQLKELLSKVKLVSTTVNK